MKLSKRDFEDKVMVTFIGAVVRQEAPTPTTCVEVMKLLREYVRMRDRKRKTDERTYIGEVQRNLLFIQIELERGLGKSESDAIKAACGSDTKLYDRMSETYSRKRNKPSFPPCPTAADAGLIEVKIWAADRLSEVMNLGWNEYLLGRMSSDEHDDLMTSARRTAQSLSP